MRRPLNANFPPESIMAGTANALPFPISWIKAILSWQFLRPTLHFSRLFHRAERLRRSGFSRGGHGSFRHVIDNGDFARVLHLRRHQQHHQEPEQASQQNAKQNSQDTEHRARNLAARRAIFHQFRFQAAKHRSGIGHAVGLRFQPGAGAANDMPLGAGAFPGR